MVHQRERELQLRLIVKKLLNKTLVNYKGKITSHSLLQIDRTIAKTNKTI